MGLQQMLMQLILGGGAGGSTPFTGGFGGYGGGLESPAFGSNAPYTGRTSFQPLPGGRFPVQDRTPAPIANVHEVAPEVQRALLELRARWPGDTTDMGTHVVKYIRGNPSNGLSYHSYGDAADIGGPGQQLEQQASWLARKAERDKLDLSEIIFRDAIWTDDEGWHPYTYGGHDTHIHITGPQGVYSDTSPWFPKVRYRLKPPNPVRDSGGPIPVDQHSGGPVKSVKVSPYKRRYTRGQM